MYHVGLVEDLALTQLSGVTDSARTAVRKCE